MPRSRAKGPGPGSGGAGTRERAAAPSVGTAEAPGEQGPQLLGAAGGQPLAPGQPAEIVPAARPDEVDIDLGQGSGFQDVEPETKEAYVAALDDLRAELEARGATVKDGHWGYRLLVVEDLDGNQLYFNYPKEP